MYNLRRGGGRRAVNIWPGFVDALATLLLVVIFQLLVFGTQYAAFKDIFGLPPAAGDEGARADDQLVA